MTDKTQTTGVWRLARGIARGLGSLLIGVVLLLAALLLAINLPPVNGLLVGKLDAVLAGTFRGRVVVQRIRQLSLSGIGGADFEVFDAAGHSVLRAEGADVWLSVPAFAYHALTGGKDPLRIPIQKVELRHASVTLLDDGTGTPTLAQAFEPRAPAPEAQPSRPPELSVDRIALGKLEVRGALAATGPVEVDLSSLDARLASGARGLEFSVERLEIEARRLPRVRELSGRLSGGVFLPTEGSARSEPTPPDPTGLSTQAYALREAPSPRRVDVKFNGEVAGSAVALQLHLLGVELHAALDAPQLSASTVGELAPGLRPATPLGLSAQLDGALEALAFRARLSARKALATLSGEVRLRNSVLERVTARLEGSDFDLSELAAGAPVTRLRFSSDAAYDGTLEGGHGSYRLRSKDSKVNGIELPELELTGQFEAPRARPLHTAGKLTWAEPGAPLEVHYALDAADALSAQLSAKLELDRPLRLRTLTGVSAAGSLVANVRFEGGSEQLDADLGVRLRELTHPEMKLRRLSAALVARGGLHAPELRASLDASRVQVAGRSLPHVWLRVLGTPERLHVKAHATGRHPDQVDLYALFVPGSKRLVRAPFVLVKDGPDQLSIAVEHIDVEPNRWRVAGLTLGGPGSARASLVYGRSLERLELQTRALDIARVLGMFGLKTPLKSAEADLDVHLAAAGREPNGKITGELRDVDFAGVSGSARADLSLERGRIDGTLALDATDVGTTQVTFKDLRAPLRPPNLRDLKTLAGEVSLGGELELARLGAVLPLLGVERGEGHVRYQLSLGRAAEATELPALRVHVDSRDLVLVGQRADTGQPGDAESARRAAPWSLRGLDLDVDAELADRQAKLRGRIFDEHGELAHFDASWRDLLAARSGSRLMQSFLRAPFEAKIAVPERALQLLPEAVRPAGVEGALAFDLDAQGTLADPSVRAKASVRGFAAGKDAGLQQPARLDLALSAELAPAGGEISLKALQGVRQVSKLQTHWSGDARRLAGSLEGTSPIRAALDLTLDAFPLDVVPQLATRELRGELTGRARLDGLGKDAHLDVSLSSHDLVLARAALGDFETTLRGGGGTLDVRTALSGRAGKARIQLSVPLGWGDRLVPTSDGQVQGSFETEGLRLSLLEPLVAGSIGQLGGKLDSSFTADRVDGEMRLAGHATLTEGIIDTPSLGQRFTDIGAKLELSPGQLRIDELHARGQSGGFDGSVQAELDGLLPRSAQASLHIKESDKLPIAVQGETMGDVWGNIEAHYQADPANQTQSIDVDLQKLQIELPAAPPRGIASLDQPKYIRVGYFRHDTNFVAIDLQPLAEPSTPSEQKTVVSVDLNDVTVRKGDQGRVVLGGKVDATLGTDLDVQGTIEARGGELDVSGKTFDIERGTVSFTGGSPDDPTINAVARYDAPAGYTVYAEYVGTARKGKLNLRAEPTLTQDEIVTLLLFGSPDGSLGSGNGDSLSTAVSVAGGAAAQSLNRAISDVTNLDVSARVDTSTGAPRPELVLQLTPGTAAKVTQALGEPAPGESPDRTFLTLDLRLASTWSLSTTVGDRGASALDLIWRKRY